MKQSTLLAAGLTAAFAASAAQAEVKINDNFSFDGYFIGAGVVTEGTAAKNGPEFGESGAPFDSGFIALNGVYGDFSGKVSLYTFNPLASTANNDVGVLDAYVTYKTGNLALTGGKYLSWLGFESFHSPSNAFISFSEVVYAAPFTTGVKADYAGEGFSTGVSVRDSQIAFQTPPVSFYEGDGEFSDDIGYEVYFMFTAIEKLTLFTGLGYEDVDGGSEAFTFDFWASYAVTEKLSVAAEYAITETANNYSWLLQSSYAISDKLSVAARLTANDTDGGDSFAYGVASTYAINDLFSVKGEITLREANAGGADRTQYALQGLFRF